MPEWLGALGVDVPETVVESGLMYLSRWYRLPDGIVAGDRPEAHGRPRLREVHRGARRRRRRCRSRSRSAPTTATCASRSPIPSRFEHACRALPGPDQFFATGALEPCGPVRPMGGLLNRIRRFVDADGRPTVLGFHAIGDAHTCTNPLYGRGCSLAVVQALLVTDAARRASRRSRRTSIAPTRRAAGARSSRGTTSSVQMDRLGADPAGLAGVGPGGVAGGKAVAALFVAAGTDPVIGRGLARFWNLLATPSDLMADGELLTRMAAVMADPDAYPVPPRDGPVARRAAGDRGRGRRATTRAT